MGTSILWDLPNKWLFFSNEDTFGLQGKDSWFLRARDPLVYWETGLLVPMEHPLEGKDPGSSIKHIDYRAKSVINHP